jgi:hypothetical protein
MTMDDRIAIPMNSKRHAEEILNRLADLHDKSIPIFPQIIRQLDKSYAIQVSRFDGRIMRAWQAYIGGREGE